MLQFTGASRIGTGGDRQTGGMGRFLRISQFLQKRGALSAKIFVGLFLKYRTGLGGIVCAGVPRVPSCQMG